ncbi:uncharacterized protein LOC116108185 [Pistacia vera]|uniref:uncharacterized protein LOC116108185 n=1 Tax=Pistacia vera TaxID=55513 RepID=UPI001262C29D|nr:uncharacterized protein LOC116108185 [Pistacia vera]
MASMVAETWAIINGEDDSNGVEISKFNNALLMSLLEESYGEEYNDEQVNRVIQSLEAEINANMLEAGDDLAMEPEFLGLSDDEDGQNSSASMEFEWAEMEPVPSSPSYDMNWFVDHCENELDLMVEYGDVGDYNSQIYSVVSSEENCFSSLWHENYKPVAYN